MIAALVLLPIAAVFSIALAPAENIWPHLMRTTLPRYMANSAILVAGVGVLAGAIGTGAAWLVTMYRFPGSGWLQWALLLPLAIPAYVGAYALVDFFEYAGPVQTAMRSAFGWTTSRDYWFPEIRSMGSAILVLSAALFPYVYLMVRTALREQSAGAFEVARALGAGPLRRFTGLGLPLVRPAIAAGTAIVMMETVSDFGAVSYFSVQTLTTGIFTTWLDGGNAGGAAQIASLILIVVFALVAMEKASRRNMRYAQSSRQARPFTPIVLKGPRAWVAAGLCLVPFLFGFVLPGGVILAHAIDNLDGFHDPGLLRALRNTLVTCGAAAALTLTGALFLTYSVRMARSGFSNLLLPLTTIGYAAPGAVLGVGILLPLASVDHWLADTLQAATGTDPGLLLTGTSFALIYAYSVRFFAIAQGATDSGLGRIPPSLGMAARSLGQSQGQALRRVTLPIMRASIGSALLLVFVDCIKELPATLLLRPFNFNTLSTRTYEKASLEQIGNAAPAAMLVIGVSLLAVLLLARAQRDPATLRGPREARKPSQTSA